MQTKRVLVIDDEQIVLDSVERILGEKGIEVDTAMSSREGSDRALREQYDLVLTDVRMPGMTGMRVLRDIKRFRPSLPVVIITGYATVHSAVQAMKLGATDYVEKPFTPEELVKVVAAALDVAGAPPVEGQALVHKQVVIEVLERVAGEAGFFNRLIVQGADALEEYELTGPEKLALLTGDIDWIEAQLGPLTDLQKRWFERRLSGEIW